MNENNWSYTCVCNTCDKTKAEVCDTNGVTHLNLCTLNRLICLGQTNATKDHDGACAREYYSSYLFGIKEVSIYKSAMATFRSSQCQDGVEVLKSYDVRAFVNLSQNLSSNFFSAWSSRYEKQVKKKKKNDCEVNLSVTRFLNR